MGFNESRYRTFYLEKNKSHYHWIRSSKLSAVSQNNNLRITADFHQKTNSLECKVSYSAKKETQGAIFECEGTHAPVFLKIKNNVFRALNTFQGRPPGHSFSQKMDYGKICSKRVQSNDFH